MENTMEDWATGEIEEEDITGIDEETAYEAYENGEITYREYQQFVELLQRKNKGKFQIIPRQQNHIDEIVNALNQSSFHLDTSQMGSGKTYTTCTVAKRLGYNMFIVSPINVIGNWFDTCKATGTKLAGITNYEKLIRGRWWDFRGSSDRTKLYRKDGTTDCPYFPYNEVTNNFEWDFSVSPGSKFLVVFDEAHKLKNKNTTNFVVAEMLRNYILESNATNESNARNRAYVPIEVKVLYLTATPIQRADDWTTFFYLCNRVDKLSKNEVKSTVGAFDAEAIHKYMEETDMVSRMTTEIPYKNDIQVIRQEITDESALEIDRLYGLRDEDRAELLPIVQFTKDNQVVELMKCSIFVEYALDRLKTYQELLKKKNKRYEIPDKDYSVIIFINYKKSMDHVKSLLLQRFKEVGWNTDIATISGDNSPSTNAAEALRFNSGTCRVLIATYAAGSASISLHDTVGDKPRYVILNATVDTTLFTQALGRAFRTGQKSDVKQRVIFVSNPNYEGFEDKLAKMVEEKLNFITKSVSGQENKILLSNERTSVATNIK